jgi:hypothetical protein
MEYVSTSSVSVSQIAHNQIIPYYDQLGVHHFGIFVFGSHAMIGGLFSSKFVMLFK